LDSAIRNALGREFVVVLNVPSSWLIFPRIDPRLREGAGGMVFRAVCAIAALLIGLEESGGKASAQYYPPAQAYPPPQAYPPQVYYLRQGYRPPVVDDDDDNDVIYDLEGRPLPPGATAKPQANQPTGGRYGSAGTYRDGRQRGYRDVPQQGGDDYEPYYGVPRGIPPDAASSAEQDAIRQEAMRSRLPISPGQIGPGAALPPEVRPETGPKKELPPQFRRTLVDLLHQATGWHDRHRHI
jgi:hypothetical protein